jgi:hypothetical protein
VRASEEPAIDSTQKRNEASKDARLDELALDARVAILIGTDGRGRS